MPVPRYGKRDKNEPIIIAALVAAGAGVVQLNIRDKGDLLVGYMGKNYVIEVKSEKGQLRPGQAEWHESWQGQVAVVRTPEEALAVIYEQV